MLEAGLAGGSGGRREEVGRRGGQERGRVGVVKVKRTGWEGGRGLPEKVVRG